MNPAIFSILGNLLFSKIAASASAPASGGQSTEFWATSVISVWAALSPSVPAPYNVAIPAIAVGIYTISRTVLKAAHALGYAKNVPDLAVLSVEGAPVQERKV